MRRRSSRVALLLALLLGGHTAYGQEGLGPRPKRPRAPDDYRPRTLKEVAAEPAAAGGLGNKEETMRVDADILPSRVRAVYAGAARPLPQAKREVLRQWARLYAGAPETYTEPYRTEMLFAEGGASHWLAVRKGDVPRLRREIKKGAAAELYLVRMGSAKTSGGWESLLLVESFRKPD